MTETHYVLTRDISDQGRTIPKGTRLSDVYEVTSDLTEGARADYTAFAYPAGGRVKVRLTSQDIGWREPL